MLSTGKATFYWGLLHVNIAVTKLLRCGAVLLAELESLVEQLDEQEAAKRQAMQRAQAAEQQLATLKKQASQSPQVSAGDYGLENIENLCALPGLLLEPPVLTVQWLLFLGFCSSHAGEQVATPLTDNEQFSYIKLHPCTCVQQNCCTLQCSCHIVMPWLHVNTQHLLQLWIFSFACSDMLA